MEFSVEEKEKILSVIINKRNKKIMRLHLLGMKDEQIAQSMNIHTEDIRKSIINIWELVCSEFLKNKAVFNAEFGKWEKVCKDCGVTFYTKTKSRTKCCDCLVKDRKLYEDTGIRANERKTKIENGEPIIPIKEKKKPKKTFGQVIAELEAYNKANGTCLTYGQYLAMIGE